MCVVEGNVCGRRDLEMLMCLERFKNANKHLAGLPGYENFHGNSNESGYGMSVGILIHSSGLTCMRTIWGFLNRCESERKCFK